MIIEDSGRYWVGHDHKGPWPPKEHWIKDRFNIIFENWVSPTKDYFDKEIVIEKAAEFSDSYNFLTVPLRWGFKNYDDAFMFMLAFPSVYKEDWRTGNKDE